MVAASGVDGSKCDPSNQDDGSMHRAIYDYAKFVYGQRENSYVQIIRRATDITGFSGLTTGILFYVLQNGTIAAIRGNVIVFYVFIIGILFMMASIASAIYVMRIKFSQTLKPASEMYETIELGKLTKEGWLLNALVESMGEADAATRGKAKNAAIVLNISHALLSFGIISLFICIVYLVMK